MSTNASTHTPRGEVRRFPDSDAAARAAAEEFVRAAGEAVAARGRFSVALSGGSTPKKVFQLLATPEFVGRVDWARVLFFWGDERAVPPDHADSNFKMASDALLSRLPARPAAVVRLEAERPDRDAAARDAQTAIAAALGASADGPPPALDLVMLGMGSDGHTASLFPHTAALGVTDPRRWVVANHVPKLSADRLTFAAAMINAARSVLFLVTGPDKAAPLSEVLEGPPDPQRLPSQLIRPASGRLVWMVDKAAAARLKG
jgi:6-phosphogluconolactonase